MRSNDDVSNWYDRDLNRRNRLRTDYLLPVRSSLSNDTQYMYDDYKKAESYSEIFACRGGWAWSESRRATGRNKLESNTAEAPRHSTGKARNPRDVRSEVTSLNAQ